MAKPSPSPRDAGAPSPSATAEVDVLLALIRRRRATRAYTPEPLDRPTLLVLAEAAQRIPTGGNRQQGRLVVVQAPEQLRRILAVSPGIPGEPTALLVLCVDWSRLPSGAADDSLYVGSLHVDLGAAMENVVLAAEALGLASCPVMSFHRPSVKRLLRLPSGWEPHVMVAVGHLTAKPKRKPAELHAPMYWDRYDPGGNQAPEGE